MESDKVGVIYKSVYRAREGCEVAIGGEALIRMFLPKWPHGSETRLLYQSIYLL